MYTQRQLQILALLMDAPGREYYLSEIGERLGKHPGVFMRGLSSLEKEGILTSRKKGNQRLVTINPHHVFYHEISSMVKKAAGAEGSLRDVVKKIKEIRLAFIYGSYAKGGMRADSDIDLIAVTDKTSAEDLLLKNIVKIEKQLSRECNYKIYSTREFDEKRRSKDPFLSRVLSEKMIMLKGKIA